MRTFKLTRREESRVISEKHLDFAPDPRGLGYAFYNAMSLNKNEAAQIDGETGEIDTFGNLLRRCVRVCMHLLFNGITKDDVICQCSSNHVDSCVPIVCAYFLGATAAPLDPQLSLDEVTRSLDQIRPRIIFVSTEVAGVIVEALNELGVSCAIVVFGTTEEHVPFDELLESLDDETEFKPLAVKDLDETAVILFNDGRKVSLSHCCLLIQLINVVCCCNCGNMCYLSGFLKERTQSGFMVATTYLSYSSPTLIHLLNSATLTGMTRVISQNFEPRLAWKLIDKHKIALLISTTPQAVQLYREEKPEGVDGKSLKMILTIGTYLTSRNMDGLRKVFPRCFITNCYEGMAIGGPISMFSFIKPGDIRDQCERPTSSGKLLPGVACKIVDPITGKILGANEAGELRYKANFLCASADLDNDGWIKTGDIAFYDEKHCIYVLDPFEDVFKYKCWHIIPSIVEAVIKAHPAVKEAAVVGIPQQDKSVGEVATAIVSLNERMKAKVRTEDIDLYANEHLSKKQQLKGGVRIITRVPMTPRGQPRRQELKSMVLTEIS